LNDSNNRANYLVQDPSIECWTGNHPAVVFGFALPMLLFYSFFILIAAFLNLRNVSNCICEEEKKELKLGTALNTVLVTGGIRPEYYYWELLVLIRKSIIALILVVSRS